MGTHSPPTSSQDQRHDDERHPTDGDGTRMTHEPTHPPGPETGIPAPDDELVSAVLDGEASPDEVARVEGDPVLAERLRELRAVATAVAAPVAPHPALDDLLGRALASADEPPAETPSTPVAPDPTATHTSGVADLGAARRRRERTRRLLAVAAVVAVLALAVPLLGSLDEGDTDSAETASVSAGDAADPDTVGEADESLSTADGAGSGLDDATAEAAVPTTTAAGPASSVPPDASASARTAGLGALGEFAATAPLVDVVRDLAARPSTDLDADQTADAPADGAFSPSTCPTLLAGLDPPAIVATSGTATVEGRPVVVVVTVADASGLGAQVLVVTADCTAVLDQQPLDG